MQVRAISTGAADEAVHGDFLQRRQVAKRDRAVEESEGCSAARGAQGAVFVVGGGVVPGAEAGGGGPREGAGGVVSVVEGEEVGREGGVVGLFEAGEGEGAGDEEAGGGIGGAGGLMGVERAAVVFWGAEFIANGRGLATSNGILVIEKWGGKFVVEAVCLKTQKHTYRLGGNCVFRLLLRAIGLNDLIASSEGPGA